MKIGIIGGGVIGLSLAWELAQRGCDVTVHDAAQFDSGTTSAASGILPPANFPRATDAIDRLRGFSHEHFPVWAQRLLDTTGVDIELRRCGGWYLADGPGEAASLVAMRAYWNELEIESRSVPVADFLQSETSISGRLVNSMTAALWAPDEYRIDPRAYTTALKIACEQFDVQLKGQCPVSDVQASPEGVRVGSIGGETVFDQAVLCGGPLLGMIDKSFRLDQAIIPIRGQIIQYQLPPGMIRGIVNVGNRYLLQRDDGRLLVGSCEEEAGFDCRTTPEMLDSLRQFGESLIPELANAPIVDRWAGLRPMTFDGFPMIGPVPEQDGIFVAGGHYRSGIHLSPGTAITLADAMLGNTPAISLDDFRIMKQQSSLPLSFE